MLRIVLSSIFLYTFDFGRIVVLEFPAFIPQIFYSLLLLLMTQVIFDYVGYAGLFIMAGIIGSFGKITTRQNCIALFGVQYLYITFTNVYFLTLWLIGSPQI